MNPKEHIGMAQELMERAEQESRDGGNKWRSRFGSSERLHFHFYHGALTAQQLRTHKRAATEGTRELLVMLSAST